MSVALAAATLLLYSQTAWFGFVDYDDTDYVLDNPHVSTGLNFPNLVWAFRESYAANWHPLTWLSHMVDSQLFGTHPGLAHVVNAVLHTVNSVLLFVLLFRMTGFAWRSWVVAALFAFHPLHVESVAWIAERKDVLSTFFFLLTLLAYARYVHQHAGSPLARNREDITGGEGPGSSPAGRTSLKRAIVQSATSSTLAINTRRDRDSGRACYWLALACFACGLLSKPMVVTLPFILLLLDYWPLRRLSSTRPTFQTPPSALASELWRAAPGLLLEKIPFFTLAGVVSTVTFIAQKHGGAVSSLNLTPLSERLANAVLSYWRYLGKMFWPKTLFIPYVPELDRNPLWAWLAGAALLIGTFAAVALVRRRYLAVGCLWYIGTLAPAIGIVKVGSQTMADRYTYIPLVGVFILLVWFGADLVSRWRLPRALTISVCTAALGACLALTFRQIGYWKNGEALFLHSAAADPTNLPVLACLASSYATNPDPKVRNGPKAVLLGEYLVAQTRRAEPGYLDILSTAYAETGQFNLALRAAEETLRLPAAQMQPFFLSQVKNHLELYKAGKAVRQRSPGL